MLDRVGLVEGGIWGQFTREPRMADCSRVVHMSGACSSAGGIADHSPGPRRLIVFGAAYAAIAVDEARVAPIYFGLS